MKTRRKRRILRGRKGVYFLIRKIGSGSSAEVWKAVRLFTGGYCAVKFRAKPEQKKSGWKRTGVPGDVSCGGRFLLPLEAEARLLEELYTDARDTRKTKETVRLENGIPGFLEYIQDESREYLVMEYLEGKTLGEMMREGKRLSFSDTLAAGRSLCRILCFLQKREHPVFHLDLSPDNIIVRKPGKLFLTDFGAAAAWRERAHMEEKTVYGTRGYAAPEQYTGMVSERTDLYGFGMVLHQLWNREKQEISEGEKIHPAERMMERALICCTAADPMLRFGSAEELEGILKKIEKQKRVCYNGSTLQERPAIKCRKKKQAKEKRQE